MSFRAPTMSFRAPTMSFRAPLGISPALRTDQRGRPRPAHPKPVGTHPVPRRERPDTTQYHQASRHVGATRGVAPFVIPRSHPVIPCAPLSFLAPLGISPALCTDQRRRRRPKHSKPVGAHGCAPLPFPRHSSVPIPHVPRSPLPPHSREGLRERSLPSAPSAARRPRVPLPHDHRERPPHHPTRTSEHPEPNNEQTGKPHDAAPKPSRRAKRAWSRHKNNSGQSWPAGKKQP